MASLHRELESRKYENRTWGGAGTRRLEETKVVQDLGAVTTAHILY